MYNVRTMKFKWTKKSEELLKKRLKRKESVIDISIYFGISINAVYKRAQRLGISVKTGQPYLHHRLTQISVPAPVFPFPSVAPEHVEGNGGYNPYN